MAKVKVPVTKGKGYIEVDTASPDKGGDLPDAVYQEAVLQGLKVLFNRGMSKLTKEAFDGDEEKLKAAAMEQAEINLAAIREGKIKYTGQKASKVSGEVKTEARRLARNLVKDEMKRQNIKVSHVESSEITKAANALLDSEQGEAIIKQATENIAERQKTKIAIDVTAIPISTKKVQKAEKEKAERKAATSAAKAGKVQVRAKPQPQATAH